MVGDALLGIGQLYVELDGGVLQGAGEIDDVLNLYVGVGNPRAVVAYERGQVDTLVIDGTEVEPCIVYVAGEVE